MNKYLARLPYIKIPLHGKHGAGKHTLVDGDYDGEYFSRFRWYLNKAGYAVRSDTSKSRNRSYIYLHREVMGHSPEKMICDHINRNKLDNRSRNLRFVTYQENTLNRVNKRSPESGYYGVRRLRCKRANGSVWVSKKWGLFWGGKYRGGFDTPEEAARRWDKLQIEKYGKEWATLSLNFPNS